MLITCSLVNYYQEAVNLEQLSNPFPWQSKSIIDSLKINTHLAIFVKDQLVGFVIYRVIIDECEVIHLVTHINCRREGIAGQLLSHLFNLLARQRVKSIFLEVREDNYAALSLYRKYQFIEINKRKNYYKGEIDALVMKKIIE